MGIVATDLVRADHQGKKPEQPLPLPVPGGFAGEDQLCRRLHPTAQCLELRSGELMEDQVATYHLIGIEASKGAQVGAVPFCLCRPGGWGWTDVEAINRPAIQPEAAREFARASAELEHRTVRARMGMERAGEPAVVSHGCVDQPKVATVVSRIGMIVRERVEQLGLDGAGRHTVRCWDQPKRQMARRAGRDGADAYPARLGSRAAFSSFP